MFFLLFLTYKLVFKVESLILIESFLVYVAPLKSISHFC